MAQIICILYWFNPLVWYAVRQLRILRELASDDYVLRSGTKPSVYANHLLEITKLLRSKSFFGSSSTVAFAQKTQVETRLLAILDSKQSHLKLSNYMKGFVIFVVVAFSLSLSVLQLKSQNYEVDEATNYAQFEIIEDIDLPENRDYVIDSQQNFSQLNYNLLIKNKSISSISKNVENVKKSQPHISTKQNPSMKQSENLIKPDQTSPSPLKNNNKLNPLNSLTTPLNGLQNKLKPLKTNSTSAEN